VAGRIRSEDVVQVRERSPIAEVIGEQLALRNAGGGNLKGLCPFHDEKSPSFSVSPGKGVFYCFGCGESGDVFSFVQKLDHLSFSEAVERLAARANVVLRYEQGGAAVGRQGGQRLRLVEAGRLAQEFYAEQLRSDEARPAREFLAVRGFDDAVAADFGCGYAPGGFDVLTRHLLGRGFAAEELVTAGLSRRTSRGSLSDRFSRRLLWPVRDLAGDPVGFGARRLFDDDPIEAKYLNTPETPLYKKSTLLYGVDRARREIARRHQAVIVEGYTDVMAAHLAGVPTAVATCGTSFGTEHIAVLRRLLMDQDEFRGEVIFTFDGDAAGQKAALRAFDDDQRFVAQTFVAVEPHGLDPCELRQTRGDAAVRDLIARRVPLFAFALRAVLARYDLETAEGRVQALEAAAPLVARIKDRSLRPEYARRLAGDLGMEVEPVLRRVAELTGGPASGPGAADRPGAPNRHVPDGALNRHRPDGGRDGPGGQPTPPLTAGQRPARGDPGFLVEREALKLAVQLPAMAGPLFDAVDLEAFTAPAHAALRAAVAAAGGAGSPAAAGPAWLEQLQAACSDDVTRSLVVELAVEPLRVDGEPSPRYVSTVLSRLAEMAVVRRIAALRSRVQRVNPVESPAEHSALFGQLIALEQQRRGLREQGMA